MLSFAFLRAVPLCEELYLSLIKSPKPDAIVGPHTHRDAPKATHGPLLLIDSPAPNDVAPHQQLHQHARLGMPHVVAVKGPHPGVIQHDADNRPAVPFHRDSIPPERIVKQVKLRGKGGKGLFGRGIPAAALVEDEELVAVEVERVRAVVKVVDGKVDGADALGLEDELPLVVECELVDGNGRAEGRGVGGGVEEAVQRGVRDVVVPGRLVEEAARQAPVANHEAGVEADVFVCGRGSHGNDRMQGRSIEVAAYHFDGVRPLFADGLLLLVRDFAFGRDVAHHGPRLGDQTAVLGGEAVGDHAGPHPEGIGGGDVCFYHDAVTLSREDVEAVKGLGKDVRAVDLGDVKGVLVELDLEFGKGADVDETQTVALAGGKVEGRRRNVVCIAFPACKVLALTHAAAVDEAVIRHGLVVLHVWPKIVHQNLRGEVVVVVLDHDDSVRGIFQLLQRGPLIFGMNDDGPEKAVRRLGAVVGVVPVGTRLVLDLEFVGECRVGRNGALGDADGAVHGVCAVLIEAVEVDRGGIDGFVLNNDANGVAFVALNQRSGKLVVDEYHWSIDAVWVQAPIDNRPMVLSDGRSSVKVPRRGQDVLRDVS